MTRARATRFSFSSPSFIPLVAALLVATLTNGCILVELWQTRRSEQVLAQYAYVAGTVASESGGTPWMVVLLVRLPCDEDWRAPGASLSRTAPSPWKGGLRRKMR